MPCWLPLVTHRHWGAGVFFHALVAALAVEPHANGLGERVEDIRERLPARAPPSRGDTTGILDGAGAWHIRIVAQLGWVGTGTDAAHITGRLRAGSAWQGWVPRQQA